MIWVCRECHGRIHGLQWNSEHSNLTRLGLAKAKAAGRVGGNPKLRDPEFIKVIAAARKAAHRETIKADADVWLPIVRDLRPKCNWVDVARAVSRATKAVWSTERLRRTVGKLAADGLIEQDVLDRAPAIRDVRVSDHLVPLIRVLYQGKSLKAVASELEKMGERTPRGGARWHTSSVASLLKTPSP